MIKIVVFDIDGVLTDGRLVVDHAGNEQKHVHIMDIDAVYSLHQDGCLIGVITGEDTPIVDYFENRFPWDYFYRGRKDKQAALEEILADAGLSSDEACYIGDGRYDAPALRFVGFGACPADATEPAKVAADVILHHDGGDGCIWELVEILKRRNGDNPAYRYFYDRAYEHTRTFKGMVADYALMDNMAKIGDAVVALLAEGRQVFFCGNGGSAADAQHLATEFVSRFYRERPGMNAEALTVNTSTLTAVGNDYSFERVFSRQLEAKSHPGDMLFGITTSGRSKNVLEAFRYASSHGVTCVALLGDHVNPELDELCDYVLKVPSKVTPRIQEAHIFLGHMLAEYVEEKSFGSSEGKR